MTFLINFSLVNFLLRFFICWKSSIIFEILAFLVGFLSYEQFSVDRYHIFHYPYLHFKSNKQKTSYLLLMNFHLTCLCLHYYHIFLLNGTPVRNQNRQFL
jgi:hypothetical protein